MYDRGNVIVISLVVFLVLVFIGIWWWSSSGNANNDIGGDRALTAEERANIYNRAYNRQGGIQDVDNIGCPAAIDPVSDYNSRVLERLWTSHGYLVQRSSHDQNYRTILDENARALADNYRIEWGQEHGNKFLHHMSYFNNCIASYDRERTPEVFNSWVNHGHALCDLYSAHDDRPHHEKSMLEERHERNSLYPHMERYVNSIKSYIECNGSPTDKHITDVTNSAMKFSMEASGRI